MANADGKSKLAASGEELGEQLLQSIREMKTGLRGRVHTMDTVKMVRSIRDAHYEEIKDLSTEEKIDFFRRKARALYAELGRSEERLDDSATTSTASSR
jgi:hypothetical protein